MSPIDSMSSMWVAGCFGAGTLFRHGESFFLCTGKSPAVHDVFNSTFRFRFFPCNQKYISLQFVSSGYIQGVP